MRTIVMAITILLAPHATADPVPRERAALAAIDVGPGVPAYLRAAATSQIELKLAAAGYEVAPPAEVAARLTGELASCRDGACVRRVGEALAVRWLVFAAIDGEDDNTVVTMRLHDGHTGERRAEVREVCDLCGHAELSERVATAAAALTSRAPAPREPEATQAPRAPAAAAAAPPVVAPAPPAVAEAPAGGRRSMVPGILVGAAGMVAVAGGLYLMAIDGRGTCDRGDGPVYPDPDAVIRYPDPSTPDRFVCRELYDTRTPGIASAAAGAAAIAAGIALVVRARHRDPAVEIVPRPGGAQIGVSWSW